MSAALGILATGFAVGLGVAAPIGPVNIEIIRRGLRSGFREPFALGMGAVTADAIYLAVVCLGVSHVAQYRIVRLALFALGFATLELLGIGALRAAGKITAVPGGGAEPAAARSLFRVYALGMAMMANPFQVAAWLGFSSLVVGQASGNPWAYVWFAISVPAGCTSWVVFICTILHYGRRYVTPRVLRAVNVLGGLNLCGFGLYLLWQFLRTQAGG